jgi:hypothetical protein
MPQAAFLGRCNCGGTHFTVDGTQLLCSAHPIKGGRAALTQPLFATFYSTALNVLGPVVSYTKADQKAHHFCPSCGSLLFTTGPCSNDTIEVALSALDESDAEVGVLLSGLG